MRISKYIEEILVDKFKEFGFEYQKSPAQWLFVRSSNGYKEFIEIDKSDWIKNAIRCNLYVQSGASTNTIYLVNDKVDVWTPRFSDLESIIEEFGEIADGWHRYSDITSLKEELHKILVIVEQFGMQWFEQNPPEKFPEDDNFLNPSWKPKLERFIQAHEIDLHDANSLFVLDRLIKQGVSSEEIPSISFCFGQIIINTFGGEWDYDIIDGPFIKNIAGVPNYIRSSYIMVKEVISLKDTTIKEMFDEIVIIVKEIEKNRR
ncbi:hypothetical protein [Paenibacillus sp. USDA918EY]|uniref:hypothetical protein n=1 Tax=Paenibacillus sp. USDA918EY TaxID=2689575 RepID=UPI00135BAF2C|nr:hypothetical protein [Paenibacillus sp. USDA918EY]